MNAETRADRPGLGKRGSPTDADPQDKSASLAAPTDIARDPDRLLLWIDAYLTGWQRGYEARRVEEAAGWPPAKVLVLGRWFDQATERKRWDDAVRREVASGRG